MIRPISQAQLQNISNPASASMNRLANSLSSYGDFQRQNRLEKMQQQQIADQQARQSELDQKAEQQHRLDNMAKFAPVAVQAFQKALAIPDEQGRQAFFESQRHILEPSGVLDYDNIEPGDFSNDNLNQGISIFQSMTKTTAKDNKTSAIRDLEYYDKLKGTDPELAKSFGRERGFISSEGQDLSSHLQKRLSTATDEAIKSEGNVGRYETLASEIEGADIGGGIFQGKWREKIKDLTGAQDAVTQLRQQYMGIRSAQAVNNLPPGVASDKDIELALKGFPTENANGGQIASFLRGMAKLEAFNAQFNTFKAEYISKHGKERGMLQAWKNTFKADTEQTNTVETQPKTEKPKQQKIGAYTIEIIN